MVESLTKNCIGGQLQACCHNPKTGFFRDGFCHTNSIDQGRHLVCAIMTEEFLTFSQSRGNDLSTPRAEFSFPGLKAGDCWCLCALRWQEAFEAGLAPPVKLECTHIKALEFIKLEHLKQKALH